MYRILFLRHWGNDRMAVGQDLYYSHFWNTTYVY
jgi:hypothetical protein